MNTLFDAFAGVCLQLNKIGIVPTLMGSLGLQFVSKKNWQPSDIDIHVPGDPQGWQAPDERRIYDWDKIMTVMENAGYRSTDLHEHAFQKDGICVQFGSVDALYDFAGISEADIGLVRVDGIVFRVPSLKQFLSIYEASSKDSYRSDKNNGKDFIKIEWLQSRL